MKVAFASLVAMVSAQMPSDFVFIRDVVPSVQESPRYYSEQNFMGRVMPGYECGRLVFSRPAAAALAKVQEDLLQSGYSLVIYDSYRPQRTVDSFV